MTYPGPTPVLPVLRNYEKAIETFRYVLIIERGYRPAKTRIAQAYAYQGRSKEALQLLPPIGTARSIFAAFMYGIAEEKDEAERILGEYLTRSGSPEKSLVARVYMSLGQTDLALEWLERMSTFET